MEKTKKYLLISLGLLILFTTDAIYSMYHTQLKKKNKKESTKKKNAGFALGFCVLYDKNSPYIQAFSYKEKVYGRDLQAWEIVNIIKKQEKKEKQEQIKKIKDCEKHDLMFIIDF